MDDANFSTILPVLTNSSCVAINSCWNSPIQENNEIILVTMLLLKLFIQLSAEKIYVTHPQT